MLVIAFKKEEAFTYYNNVEGVDVDTPRKELIEKLNKAAGWGDYWQWSSILLVRDNKVVKFLGPEAKESK